MLNRASTKLKYFNEGTILNTNKKLKIFKVKVYFFELLRNIFWFHVITSKSE